MFTVAILQRATVIPPNIIAREKGFTFYAQRKIDVYSLAIHSSYVLEKHLAPEVKHKEVSCTVSGL